MPKRAVKSSFTIAKAFIDDIKTDGYGDSLRVHNQYIDSFCAFMVITTFQC